MSNEKSVQQFFNITKFILPAGFFLFIILIYLEIRSPSATFFVVIYSIVMFLDAYLSLSHTKPSLAKGLQQIAAMDIPREEQQRRGKMLQGWQRVITACGIFGPLCILFFWFYYMRI